MAPGSSRASVAVVRRGARTVRCMAAALAATRARESGRGLRSAPIHPRTLRRRAAAVRPPRTAHRSISTTRPRVAGYERYCKAVGTLSGPDA
eukprot:3497147-Prymnesium_polylepis.1